MTKNKTIMKTILFTLLASILLSINVTSQITKKNWMLGSDATLYHLITEREGYEDYLSTSVTINPNISYFVIDKLAVGLKIGTSFNKNNTSWAIGPVARYYFLETNKIFNIFTEASFRYGRNIPKGGIDSSSGTGFSTKISMVAFLNQSVGLEFGINYDRSKNSSINDIYNTLKVAFGLQIHLENTN